MTAVKNYLMLYIFVLNTVFAGNFVILKNQIVGNHFMANKGKLILNNVLQQNVHNGIYRNTNVRVPRFKLS